jgi:hypothetical protein
MVGGLSIPAWVMLWNECHSVNGVGGVVRTAWPDGGSLLQQSALTVEVFGLIMSMYVEANRQDGK